jgi:glutathione S-transferase
MLIVHHLNNSRSQRILWMLEELGVDYEVVRYERDRATMLAPPELKAIHPLGKSPVIDDNGLVIAETGAIVEYLAEQYDGLRPPGHAERRRATYWMHFAEGSAMTPLLLKLYLSRLRDAAAPLLGRVEGQIATMLAFVQGELGDSPFLAGGELSTADIMMSFPLEAALARGGMAAYVPLVAYLDGLHARPAYQAALARGGPYELLR